VNDYFQSVRYLDGAIRLFFKELKERGMLKHSVIALYGDHDSGITPQLADAMHDPNKNVAAHDKITMIVYGLGRPRVVTRPSGLEDLGPTVLSGLGLPVPITFVGGTPNSDTSALLPGGRQIVGVDANGNPIDKPAPVDLKKLTLLSIYRSRALAKHD
jgi:arylsulfatase A-like enzyme